ncbi:MAG: hexitol phosphatase HxpB [Acidobacteria bacterium]|nr:MAG: hexitol phosphatase HxpB [Acidobacteriota bacterium]
MAFLVTESHRVRRARLGERRKRIEKETGNSKLETGKPRRPPTRAAIFDLDGLLVDSEPIWRQAEREVFAEVGLMLTDDDCRSTMGVRCDAVVALWFQKSPWQGASPAEVQCRIEARVLALMRSQGEAMPGVAYALDLVESPGCRLAVASSSSPALIDGALERLGILHRFAARCSAFDEQHGKPDPAVFLSAARKLGVDPRTCLAFEDSPPGVESAHRAGMRVVAVPDVEHRGHPGFDMADVVVESLFDLRIEHFG